MGAIAVIGGAYMSAGGFTTAFGYSMLSLGLQYALGGETISGPRLEDLSVQGSELGKAIPKLYGAGRLAGEVVWSTGLDEHKRKQTPGKGGGTEVISYTYTSSFAVMPCLGPIARPLKIWFGNECVYDWNDGDEKGIEFSYDVENDCYFADSNTKGFKRCWLYRGTDRQMPNPLIEEDKGVGQTPAYRGRVLFVVEDLELEEYGNSIPPVTMLLENCTTVARTIAEDISSMAGLTPWRHCDYRELGADINEGFVLANQSSAREYLNMLGIRHGCEWPERDGRIVAVKYGKPSCLTILERDLRTREVGGETPSTEWTREQETDLPYEIRIGHIDKNRNYTPNSQAATREVTTSELKETINLPMTMGGATAKGIAFRETYRRWLEREKVKVHLPWKHLKRASSDTVTIPTPQGLRDVRLQSAQIPYWGAIVYNAVLSSDRLTALPAFENTDPPVYPGVEEQGEAQGFVIETHALRDAHNPTPCLYVASTAPTGTAWPPTTVSALNAGSEAATLLTPAYVGTTVNRLGNHWDADYWDDANTLTVDMIRGTLETVSLDEVLNTANAAAVKNGDEWEIIQFQFAEFLGTFAGKKRYRLNHLLRGRRGTEVHMSGHVIGDTFVLLDASIGMLELPVSAIGMNLQIEFATSAGVTTIARVVTGEPLKPYAGCDLAGVRSNGNLTVSWKRRSRYRGAMLNDPQVGEVVEQFEAEILDGETVKRTVSGLNTPSFVYTQSQQIADFGSPQSAVKVRVYQLSQVVGRGYSLTGVI